MIYLSDIQQKGRLVPLRRSRIVLKDELIIRITFFKGDIVILECRLFHGGQRASTKSHKMWFLLQERG